MNQNHASNANQGEVKLVRLFLAVGAICYSTWWFVVEALLPSAFNPVLGRVLVVFCFLLTLVLSFLSSHVASRISRYYQACTWFLTAHYFYLLHHNHDQIDWLVGTYVVVAAVNACLNTRSSLLAYSAWISLLATAVSALHPQMVHSIFLPGLATILILFNLTFRHRLKLLEDLKHSTSQLESLFNATFEGIALHQNGVIIDANRAFCELFGYSPAEIKTKNVIDLVTPQNQQDVLRRITLRDETAYETMGVRRDGSQFAIEVMGRKHFYNGKLVRLAAIRDINESKVAQEAIRIRDEFLSIASHELKTPLTSFRLQTELYQRSIDRDDPKAFTADHIKKYVKHSQTQLLRLGRLIEDMLDITRIQAGKLTLVRSPFDLSIFTKDVLERFSPMLAAAQCPLHFQSPGQIMVNWDPDRIEQVIANLLTNAMKYGPGRPITIWVASDSAFAWIGVQDRGPGIAAEFQAKIFQRFERASISRNISGMGLGLYIARNIVTQHGGTIQIESTMGEGSLFTVKIPR